MGSVPHSSPPDLNGPARATGFVNPATVRRARADDAERIQQLGLGDPSFRVSDRIPFYEPEEITEWIAAPRDNVLLVAEVEAQVVGFLFCKVMSSHWAMLDSYYVARAARGTGVAAALLETLWAILVGRGIQYVSTLVATDDEQLRSAMGRYGFVPAKSYAWMERFL